MGSLYWNSILLVKKLQLIWSSGATRWNVPETITWWRHQMETFSTLLALCAGNSPVTGEFPSQRPVTQSFDVFFDLHLNKRSNKQSWSWWFEAPLHPLWRHSNVYQINHITNHIMIKPLNPRAAGRLATDFVSLQQTCHTKPTMYHF